MMMMMMMTQMAIIARNFIISYYLCFALEKINYIDFFLTKMLTLLFVKLMLMYRIGLSIGLFKLYS